MQSFGYPRFYGGHYDSTKQKDVRDHIVSENILIWREELKRRYTARLRLDILLGGNVVVTDAQFYDGLFFHALVETEKSRDDFFNFLRRGRAEMDAPLIEVRRRAGGLNKLIGKPFIFSSLITRDAKDTVKATMASVLDETSKSGQEIKSWQNFTSAINDRIDKPAVKSAFGEVIESLNYLEGAPKRIFIEWDPTRANAFAVFLKIAKEVNNFTIPTTGNAEINFTLSNIDTEMKKNFPNRGDIEQWINLCINSDPSDKNRQKMLTDLWNSICQVYNTAIADQHNCTSVDFGENNLFGSEAGELLDLLSNRLINAIVEMSWEEFLKHLTSDAKLNKSWAAFRYAISNPRPDASYSVETLKMLISLVKAIQSSYGVSANQIIKSVVGGGSSSVSYSTDGFSFKLPMLQILYRIAIAPAQLAKTAGDKSNLVKYGMNIHSI